MIVKQLDRIDISKTLDVVDEFIRTNADNANYVNAWLSRDFYESQFIKGLSITDRVFDTFIARTEGTFIYEVVGFIMGSPTSNKIYDIRQHYVAEDYRKHHVAKTLKQTLTDYARKNGYWAITSDVLKSNQASVRLNECCNWSRMELDEHTFRFYKILLQPSTIGLRGTK